ncbi:MAG: large conductance mechanosensitive channel protein MscL [Acidimicrobiales bacterium]
MLKDFKAFILRGNVVDLAVGVVIGAAFGAVVTALVKDLLTPLISIPGKTNFSSLAVKVDGGIFHYGDFLNVLISFLLLIAAAVFFAVVVPVNALMARRRTETEVEEPTRECPECLSSIPAAARRCAFCTAEVAPSAGANVPTA